MTAVLIGLVTALIVIVIGVILLHANQTSDKTPQTAEKVDNGFVSLGSLGFRIEGGKAVIRNDSATQELRDFLKADVKKSGCKDNNGATAVIAHSQDEKQLLLGYGCGNSVARCLQLRKRADGKRFPQPINLTYLKFRAARWLMKIILVMKLRQFAKMRKKLATIYLTITKYDNPFTKRIPRFSAGIFNVNYFFLNKRRFLLFFLSLSSSSSGSKSSYVTISARELTCRRVSRATDTMIKIPVPPIDKRKPCKPVKLYVRYSATNGKIATIPRTIEPNKIKRLTVLIRYFSVLSARTYAFNKSALLLQIFGNFVSVKDDSSVEIRKGDNQDKIQRWVNKCLSRASRE